MSLDLVIYYIVYTYQKHIYFLKKLWVTLISSSILIYLSANINDYKNYKKVALWAMSFIFYMKHNLI